MDDNTRKWSQLSIKDRLFFYNLYIKNKNKRIYIFLLCVLVFFIILFAMFDRLLTNDFYIVSVFICLLILLYPLLKVLICKEPKHRYVNSNLKFFLYNNNRVSLDINQNDEIFDNVNISIGKVYITNSNDLKKFIFDHMKIYKKCLIVNCIIETIKKLVLGVIILSILSLMIPIILVPASLGVVLFVGIIIAFIMRYLPICISVLALFFVFIFNVKYKSSNMIKSYLLNEINNNLDDDRINVLFEISVKLFNAYYV